jgi:hypothetical protein
MPVVASAVGAGCTIAPRVTLDHGPCAVRASWLRSGVTKTGV